MTKAIQAKHISDDQMLAVVRDLYKPGYIGTVLWDIQAAFPDMPPKVVRAKLGQMVRKGVLDGCACGCRGDFLPLDNVKHSAA